MYINRNGCKMKIDDLLELERILKIGEIISQYGEIDFRAGIRKSWLNR